MFLLQRECKEYHQINGLTGMPATVGFGWWCLAREPMAGRLPGAQLAGGLSRSGGNMPLNVGEAIGVGGTGSAPFLAAGNSTGAVGVVSALLRAGEIANVVVVLNFKNGLIGSPVAAWYSTPTVA